MSTFDANRLGIVYLPSSYLHNHHQASSAVSAPHKGQRFNPEAGVVAVKVKSMAAYSVLILLLLRLVLQRRCTRCCKQTLLQASVAASKELAPAWCCCRERTYPRRQGPNLRSYDACSSKLNSALVVAVELRLRCWRGGYGDTNTKGCQIGLRQALTWGYSACSIYVGRREFGTRDLSDFILNFCLCSAWSPTKRTTEK